MNINIFHVYEGRHLFFTEDIMELVFDYETSDIDIIHDLEEIILNLPRKSENTIDTGDVLEAFDKYFERRNQQ